MREILKLKRKWILLLIPIAIISIWLCRTWDFVAEYVYGRFIYRIMAIIIGIITRWFPFSLAEVIIYCIPVIVIVLLVRFIIRLYKNKGRRTVITGRAILNLLCFVSIVLFMFVILCGTNYYRYSFTEYLDYEVKEYDKEDLYNLCVYLVGKVNEAGEQITYKAEDGTMELSYESDRAFLNTAEDIMSEFSEDYPSLKWSTGAVKPVLASRYMSYTDIVGIFIPFTMEANVNVDTVDYNQPSDAIHELAHLRGVMREDEANYIAYLACVTSGEADFVYSGYMMAYIHAANKLYDEDYDMYAKVREMLSPRVDADLRANSEYWEQFETPVGETVSSISNQVNNTYLNINGQEEGTKSYGMVVDLLIAENIWRQNGQEDNKN